MEENTKKILDEVLEKILVEKEQDEDIKLLKSNENIDLIKDFKFDSLDIMTLIVQLEDKLGIDIFGKDGFSRVVYDYKKLLDWLTEN